MNLSSTLNFERLRTEAEKQFDLADSQLNKLESTLVERMGGRTKNKLVATIVIGFIWLVAFPVGAFFMHWGYSPANIVNLTAIISATVLALLMVFTNLALYKHFSVILVALDRIRELHNQVALGRGAIPSGMDMLAGAQRSRFSVQIQASPSVIGEVEAIDAQLSNLEAMNAGAVKVLQKVLYYVAGFAWTGASYFIAYYRFYSLTEKIASEAGVSSEFKVVVMVGALIIAFLVEWFLMTAARMGKDVNNVGLLVVAAAPLLYAVVLAAAVIALGLLWLALKIVLGLLAIVIGGAFVIGILSGG